MKNPILEISLNLYEGRFEKMKKLISDFFQNLFRKKGKEKELSLNDLVAGLICKYNATKDQKEKEKLYKEAFSLVESDMRKSEEIQYEKTKLWDCFLQDLNYSSVINKKSLTYTDVCAPVYLKLWKEK